MWNAACPLYGIVSTGRYARSLSRTSLLYLVNRAYGTRIPASIATANTASAANTADGSDSVPATKLSTKNPDITAQPHPYGQRGELTGSSGTPGRFRARSCTTSAFLKAA